ncbi:uncharacterized protein LY89DRAFT_575798 [Mollisia scopiformis]|uniref:DUF7702 domain-containing protein n=1 Tax=Mollisia scopiformis TaxID=149040 RepID=A0A194XQ80_MOLSC|nr:uncharacterized protein LY89DRAFT_575798 [Mollisia scopiformis]KUJ22316.1 hypothetical protein LY89DRAFT_575798 [Mollisia scopiformis]
MLDQPGVFTYRDAVAIIQLVPFTIYLGFAFALCFRHGFRRSEGWIILVTFSTLRVLAASFQLASINDPTNSVYGGALICQGIGLAPLTLLNFALFVRVNKFVNTIHQKIFSAISLLAIAGIVLAIYGGIESANSPTLATNDLLKASVILFVASYLAFVCIFLIFLRQWHIIPSGEQKLLLCFAYCAPFMVVRFLFSILGTYVESLRSQFGVLTGDVTVFLCMAVLEEIIVVALFVYTGMRLERLPPALRNGAKPRDSREVIELGSRE